MTQLGTRSLLLAAIAALALSALASGSTTDNFVGTIAGTGASGYSGDGGPATAAEVHRPRGIDFLSTGGLVFAESDCHTIRRISAQGVISTLAGTPAANCNSMPAPPGGYAEGTGPAAQFKMPFGVVASPGGGTVYVADAGNFVIRKIDVATGTTSLLAGLPNSSGDTDGTTTGRFGIVMRDMTISPTGSHLYVVDGNALRRVDVSNGEVVTIAGSVTAANSFADNAIGTDARFAGPNGPTTDGSTLWVGDGGNNRIRSIDLTSLTFTVVTEAGSAAGHQDGVGSAALMQDPRGLALAPDGFVYFVDAGSAVVRRFDPVSKQVVTLAGSPGQFGSVDGVGSAARFVSPRGMAIEGIHWAISDTNGSKIRGELPPLPTGGGPGGGGPTGGGPTGGGTILSAPRLTLGGKATQRVLRQGAVLVTGRCDKPCTLAATGRISFPGTARSFALRRARRTLAAPGRAVLKLRLSRASVRAVRRALRRRKRVTARVTVRASSGPGASSAPVRRRIRARR